jgi:hypothetical protein
MLYVGRTILVAMLDAYCSPPWGRTAKQYFRTLGLSYYDRIPTDNSTSRASLRALRVSLHQHCSVLFSISFLSPFISSPSLDFFALVSLLSLPRISTPRKK